MQVDPPAGIPPLPRDWRLILGSEPERCGVCGSKLENGTNRWQRARLVDPTGRDYPLTGNRNAKQTREMLVAMFAARGITWPAPAPAQLSIGDVA